MVLHDGFGGWRSDDRRVLDYYGPRGEGQTRIFISYERRSLALAKRLAQALEAEGFVAFMYTPTDASDKRVIDKAKHPKMSQVELFEAMSPGSARELEATLKRSHAFVFLVSEHSPLSGVCSVEAFSAYFSVAQPMGKRQSFVIKERSDLETPDFMWNLPNYVYEPKLETTFARSLALLFQTGPRSTIN